MAALLAVCSLVFAVLAMVTGIWMTWGYEAVTSSNFAARKLRPSEVYFPMSGNNAAQHDEY